MKSTDKKRREPSPPWHELVQLGPKGFPAKTHERREALGQVVHLNPVHEPIPRPARQGGPVRLGLYRPLRSPKTGQPGPCERIRPVKGNRIAGWVEVRVGSVRMDRVAGRQARHDARAAAGQVSTRASRRAAKTAERAA